MPAPKKNQYAAKHADQRRTSLLQLKVTPREKARLVKEAGVRKLTVYLRERLGLS